MSKQYECPKCESENVIPIVYGRPKRELMELWKNGDVKLGGCAVPDSSENMYCKSCEKKWGIDEKEYQTLLGNLLEDGDNDGD